MEQFINHLVDHFMEPQRIPFAIAAVMVSLVVGMITGPIASNANPLIWLMFGKVFGGVGERLDRQNRSRADLIFRGFVLSAVVLLVALALARLYAEINITWPAYGVTEVLLLSTLISAGSIWFVLLQLYFALEKGGQAKGAFLALSRSAYRNLNASDDMGMTRIAMGYAMRSFDKGLVAPVFWYLLLGLPAAVTYGAVSALAWQFGRSGFTRGFGAIPLVLERLLGIVPSVLAAMLLTLAGIFTPTARTHAGIACWTGLKGRAPYAQGGMPLSVLAWLLNVSLGGAQQDMSGRAIKGEWVGPEGATAQNDHKHLRRALYLLVVATFLFMLSLGGAYMWAGDSPLLKDAALLTDYLGQSIGQ